MRSIRRLLQGMVAVALLALPFAPLAHGAFPDKDKVATILVPYPAGGGNDVAVRALLPYIEKHSGMKLQIVNKGGAGSQVGMAEFVRAKPDGYTLAYPLWPALTTVYIDPNRQATFSRDSFEPVALHMVDPGVIVVRGDSPWKNLNDLVEAGKQKPRTIKVTDHGLLNAEHLMWLTMEKLTGAAFSIGHFAGGGASKAALLGGHTDAAAGGFSPYAGELKSGALRVLAILDDQQFCYAPGVPTAKEQGVDVWACSIRGFVAPAGTPADIVNYWAGVIEAAIADPEYQGRLKTLQQQTRFMGPEEFGKYWDAMDAAITPQWREASAALRGN